VPLEARLVAKKATYTLDLGGKTAEEFRKLVKTGRHAPAPQVDLVLEFHNTGGKEIKFLVGGTNPDIPLLLELRGAGAVNVVLPAVTSKMKSDPAKEVSLAPGKSYALAIKSLMTPNRGRKGSASYWTQPGEYKLIATYQTVVSPVPKGAKETRKGFGMVTLTSNALKLKIVKDKAAGARGKTDPPGVSLEARLVAKKATYTLDLGGKTAEEFRKLVKTGRYLAAPQVDLVLEFRNTGGKEIKFLVGGTNPDIPLLLELRGAGAVNVTLPAVGKAMASRPPEQVALGPGKSYTVVVQSLMTKCVGREGSASYWTGPGEYELTATYQTAVSPVPKGAKESRWSRGFGMVTVTSSPVKLKVVKEK
jgi:hypothetical protein